MFKISCRGRCPFRQYMPSKPAKYGLKWCLCGDNENAYVCHLSTYIAEQQGDDPSKNVGQTVVTELVQPYRGSGCNITTDKYFTSILLTKELLQQNMTLVGTVRKKLKFLQFLPSRKRWDESSVFGFDAYLMLVVLCAEEKLSYCLAVQHAPWRCRQCRAEEQAADCAGLQWHQSRPGRTGRPGPDQKLGPLGPLQ